MKTIFTIHAGEFLVGETLEKLSIDNNKLKIWIPSKDTGIDLLVSNFEMSQFTSIHVKYSRDFNETNNYGAIKEGCKSSGWWTLKLKDIQNTKADFWIFVLYQIHNKDFDFIIIPKENLITLYNILNEGKDINKPFHSYITINVENKVFETRDLKKQEKLQIASNIYQNTNRDLTSFLNNWNHIINKLSHGA